MTTLTSNSTSFSFDIEARSSTADILLTLAAGFLADENNSFCCRRQATICSNMLHTHTHTHLSTATHRCSPKIALICCSVEVLCREENDLTFMQIPIICNICRTLVERDSFRLQCKVVSDPPVGPDIHQPLLREDDSVCFPHRRLLSNVVGPMDPCRGSFTSYAPTDGPTGTAEIGSGKPRVSWERCRLGLRPVACSDKS